MDLLCYSIGLLHKLLLQIRTHSYNTLIHVRVCACVKVQTISRTALFLQQDVFNRLLMIRSVCLHMRFYDEVLCIGRFNFNLTRIQFNLQLVAIRSQAVLFVLQLSYQERIRVIDNECSLRYGRSMGILFFVMKKWLPDGMKRIVHFRGGFDWKRDSSTDGLWYDNLAALELANFYQFTLLNESMVVQLVSA